VSKSGSLWFAASCAAGLTLVLVIAAVVLVPVTGRESDLLAIYAMRWTALTAIFTVVSAAAIGFTAIYAGQTIALTRRTERVKQTLNLIAAYRRDGASEAFIRYRNEQIGPTYTELRRRSDVGTIIAYFEDVALQLDANIVDRDLFMRHFSDVVRVTWNELFDPGKCRVEPPLVPEAFPQFSALNAVARAWQEPACSVAKG
jgi:hypothetical protein